MSQTQADTAAAAAAAILPIRTQTTHKVSFIVSRSTGNLSHRQPASAGTFRESCRVDGRDIKDILYRSAQCTKTAVTQAAC